MTSYAHGRPMSLSQTFDIFHADAAREGDRLYEAFRKAKLGPFARSGRATPKKAKAATATKGRGTSRAMATVMLMQAAAETDKTLIEAACVMLGFLLFTHEFKAALQLVQSLPFSDKVKAFFRAQANAKRDAAARAKKAAEPRTRRTPKKKRAAKATPKRATRPKAKRTLH